MRELPPAKGHPDFMYWVIMACLAAVWLFMAHAKDLKRSACTEKGGVLIEGKCHKITEIK